MDLGKLQDKFFPEELEWRAQTVGNGARGPFAMVLCYVDARAIMKRLDDVCGPENWRDEYRHENGGVMCGISIRTENGWITKWNGSPETRNEAFKGGISKAFVRAAVNWGIGRYLYDTPRTFANTEQGNGKRYTPGWKYAEDRKKNLKFCWEIPKLEPAFLPDGYDYQEPKPIVNAPEPEPTPEPKPHIKWEGVALEIMNKLKYLTRSWKKEEFLRELLDCAELKGTADINNMDDSEMRDYIIVLDDYIHDDDKKYEIACGAHKGKILGDMKDMDVRDNLQWIKQKGTVIGALATDKNVIERFLNHSEQAKKLAEIRRELEH